MLFRGSHEQCANLVIWLNSLMPENIQFTFDFSKDKIQFLDVEIFKENGKLQTNLYIKPTNLQLFLDFSSNHPLHTKRSIIYGQALRIIERCSKISDVEFHLTKLKSKLLARNYPEKMIEDQFSRAKKCSRNQLIFQPRKNKNDKKVRLIFTFNAGGPPLHQWFRESKKLLAKNDEAMAIGENLQISYRQSRNLQQIVCGTEKLAQIDPPQNSGCFKCSKCKVSCPVLHESKRFVSTNTGKSYPIRQFLDCNSDLVIYLVTCKKCKGQYVGKSKTPFKLRHSNHKQEIKRAYGGLGHHYGGERGCGYQNLSVQLIEKVDSVENLAKKETNSGLM